jgi:hypothetical protein
MPIRHAALLVCAACAAAPARASSPDDFIILASAKEETPAGPSPAPRWDLAVWAIGPTGDWLGDPLSPEGAAVRALCPWWDAFPLIVSGDRPVRSAPGDGFAGGSLLSGESHTLYPDSWSALGFQTDERRRHKTSQTTDVAIGELNSSFVLFDAADADRVPAYRSTWSTEESLKVPLFMKPLFAYGQVGASSDAADAQAVKVTSKTGIGVKFEPLAKTEVQLRSATTMTYGDSETFRTVYGPATSQFALELLAKCPLVGPLRMEYIGTALPARTIAEHDQVKQDLRVALPLGDTGSIHVGARYRWENTLTPTPWMDRAELYLGVTLKR